MIPSSAAHLTWPAAPASPSTGGLERIAVRTRNRIVILQAVDIVRIDAEGNYVRLYANGRSVLHKASLAQLTASLDARAFLRVHRSHTVRLDAVRELVPGPHGEFRLRLADDSEITSGRAYRDVLRAAFGLC